MTTRADHLSSPPTGRRASAAGALARLPVAEAAMAVCCGLPLVWLVTQIVANPASLGALRMDAFRWGILARTIGYNAVVATIATTLALPAAWVLGRGRGPVAAALWLLLPFTLLLPSITYSYGWAQLIRLLSSPAGRLAASIFSEQSPLPEQVGVTIVRYGGGDARLVLSPAGGADVARCIWSLAAWLWALPAGIIGLALRRMDSSLQQQALLDGALVRVTARQLAGPIAASMACVTILAVQEFAVYEPTGISVVATEVRQVFQTGMFSSAANPLTAPIIAGSGGGGEAPLPDQAAVAAASVATAVPLLGVIVALSALAVWGVAKVSAEEEVDPGNWPRALEAGPLPKLLACLTVALTLCVPIAALILRHQRGFDLSLMWAQSGPEILGSISYGAMTGAAALAIAAAASVRRPRGAAALSLGAFLVGGQLLAIAVIRLYNRPGLGWVYNAPPIMVMAYLARFGWLTLWAAGATWPGPWRRLRDLAALDGAGPLQTARHVILPLAWPSLAASALLVCILALTEVPATVLISPLRPRPIVPMLMTWVHTLENDPMIEASLLLMAVVIGLSAFVAALAWAGVRAGRTRLRGAALLVGFCVAGICGGCGDRGEPQAVWLETGTAPGQVVYPRAITYSPGDDTFFIIDRVAHIQHLDHNGKYLNGWQMPEWKIGKPVGASVGPDGLLYVPDTHYHRVMVYTPTGTLVRQWGREGRGDGEFIYPTDIAFDEKGRIFVSEYGENDRIQVFDGAGRKLYQFGSFGTGDGQFSRPQSMLIDQGLVYVTDSCNHRLIVFKTDGTFVRNMGGVGTGLGQFRFPYGLDQDRGGHLIVCEFGNNRVQMVDKATGQGMKTWGCAGRDPGQLAYPWGVCVDRDDRVVTVDSGNNRVQVFEF